MGLKKNKITCDKCGQEQGFSPRTKHLADGIERIYIECSSCKTQYTACYTNPEIREIQKQQKKLAKLIARKKGWDRLNLFEEEYEMNKAKIEAKMAGLRMMMEGPPG